MIVLGKNKSTSKVAQPNCITDVKKSLSAIESQILELKSLILQKGSESESYKEKKGRGRDSSPIRSLERAYIDVFTTSRIYYPSTNPISKFAE